MTLCVSDSLVSQADLTWQQPSRRFCLLPSDDVCCLLTYLLTDSHWLGVTSCTRRSKVKAVRGRSTVAFVTSGLFGEIWPSV